MGHPVYDKNLRNDNELSLRVTKGIKKLLCNTYDCTY